MVSPSSALFEELRGGQGPLATAIQQASEVALVTLLYPAPGLEGAVSEDGVAVWRWNDSHGAAQAEAQMRR